MSKKEINKFKQELIDYIHNKKWIEERLEDIIEDRSLLDKITKNLSDMPRGSAKVYDQNAELLVSVMDDSNVIQKFVEELKEKRVKIESRIDKMPQPYKNILYFRYIKGYNLTEVSNIIDEEYDYTRKLHGLALLKYARIGERDV